MDFVGTTVAVNGFGIEVEGPYPVGATCHTFGVCVVAVKNVLGIAAMNFVLAVAAVNYILRVVVIADVVVIDRAAAAKNDIVAGATVNNVLAVAAIKLV